MTGMFFSDGTVCSLNSSILRKTSDQCQKPVSSPLHMGFYNYWLWLTHSPTKTFAYIISLEVCPTSFNSPEVKFLIGYSFIDKSCTSTPPAKFPIPFGISTGRVTSCSLLMTHKLQVLSLRLHLDNIYRYFIFVNIVKFIYSKLKVHSLPYTYIYNYAIFTLVIWQCYFSRGTEKVWNSHNLFT